jgi:soluble lytic murein transglycosylase
MRFQRKSWQLIIVWVLLGGWVVLAGCGDAPPTPTPAFPAVETATSTAVGVPKPVSTLAASATPTPTTTPSPTSTPTPTPTSSPTRTPTPTWTPTPTLQPSIHLEAALHHQTNGDYDRAIAAYMALLEGKPTPEQVRTARYHLAECYLLNRDFVAAAAAWEDFLTDYPGDSSSPQAALMAARAYHAANECARAILHYQTYLSYETVLADMVYDWIGDCRAALAMSSAEPGANLDEATAAYRLAVQSTIDRSVQAGLREKIAGIYLAKVDYEGAVAEYDAILAIARTDPYRAKIEYLAAQALAAAGQTDAAYARYRRAVDQYPQADDAYLSLVELVDAGVEMDEFQRGLVDYYAGAARPDAYGAAIRAFSRFLATEPVERADQALYWKALALRAVDEPDAALETLEALIVGYPESAWLVRAWLEKAATLAWMGDNDAAVRAYLNLAAFFPADELAPQALWRAAKIREGEKAHAEAAKLYEDLQASFPAFEDADEALWRAGLAHYQAGIPETAVIRWQALLEKYPQTDYRPKSLYWLGKLGAEPQTATEEVGYWEQLVEANPNAYYALRVQQIRAGESLTATRLFTAAVDSPTWDTVQAEAEVQSWLRGWTEVPTGTDLVNLPMTLTQRLDFRRGQALLSVGLRREALGAFDGVRAAAWGEPLALAQLAFFFHDQGLHGLAARCASRLVGLWPGGSIRDAPVAVQRLAYPLVYADLLSTEAQVYNLDPLLLAALVRQESLFEPVAESYAGARGLGQVMPATGEGIARNLGMDDFVLDDLYRPFVSIEFGAYYLAVQMNRFDNHILMALAAYNGGPGNTLRWIEAGGDDLDLFVEVITATQSRIYLQRVYEQYITYETLYRSSSTRQQ